MWLLNNISDQKIVEACRTRSMYGKSFSFYFISLLLIKNYRQHYELSIGSSFKGNGHTVYF